MIVGRTVCRVRGSHKRGIPHRSVEGTRGGGTAGGRMIRGPLSGEGWSVRGDEATRLTSRSSRRQIAGVHLKGRVARFSEEVGQC